MTILFIGDIFGRTGRRLLKDNLKKIIEKYKIDFTIANGENSAGGIGITKEIYTELISYGIDVITLGNHAWAQKQIFDFIDDANRLVRPANYPYGTPGKPYVIIESKGKKIAVINLCGRVFMDCLECPFKTADKILNEIEKKADIIILDFHAEATSEKVAMGWYLDGRVSAVLGTHTHVQTADERVLPKGTGYITDVGMTGPINSVLGVKKDIIIKKFLTSLPSKFEAAEDSGQINGVILGINDDNLVSYINRLKIS
ncbi:MAG: TIGR00282 family metallophosphoesterase [Clostridiales bacterium]|jgi:metallophosphoesterase (TIGR00282 family)|nr:TIGR00282 family metallophosphoesterase [Clostridiales bacterium]